MIGVGITTRNRPATLDKSYDAINRYAPPGSRVVVVDDASDPPALSADYRFDINVGVAAAKNKCLSLLDDCEHIFLFDSDCYPIATNWWRPYVDHIEPHLMYQFKLPCKPSTDMQELYRDENTVAYTHTRGAMLYIERKVLDVVGGMDTAYGEGMYEHTDWTNRIHNAGLTTHRAMDVSNSNQLLYCLDQDSRVESVIPEQVRRRNMLKNRQLYHKSKTSREFKEFR